MQRLPLFPLNVVLFPGSQLPLHIFEQRYRLMIGRCIEERKPFGVVLIRHEDHDTEEQSMPHLVGTIADIESAYHLDDGRMYIVTLGRQRFRINYPLTLDPYFVGMVSLLDDEMGSPELANTVRDLCEQYRLKVGAATGMRSPVLDLPADPAALSYSLADMIQTPLPKKQTWLEQTVNERLQSLIESLTYEMKLLPPIDPTKLNREPPFDSTSWN